MTDLSQLFLYIPGILIFLAGSGAVRRWMRYRRSGAFSAGNVISCSHIVKKDKKEREVYNYYDILVEYVDEKTKHRNRQNIKSPSEYAVGQEVRIYWGENGAKPVLTEVEENLFSPWVMMIGGALLILLALEENRGHEVRAMIYLSIVLIGAGVSMLWNYISLKRRNLQKIPGTVDQLYTRQISRGTKILKGDKFTYYPVVRYELKGKENFRRCNINSGSVNTFKIGDPFPLYYDEKRDQIVEKNARPAVGIFGVLILAAGILAGISIISVISK